MGVAIVALAALAGCGGGLTVDVDVDDTNPAPGQTVNWTVGVRNDTSCSTATDVSVPVAINPDDPNSPFISGDEIPVLVFVVAFSPDVVGDEQAICSLFSGCDTVDCLVNSGREIVADAGMDPLNEAAAQIVSGETVAMSPDVVSPECSPLFSDSQGTLFLCAFPPLGPGGEDTATFSSVVPPTGVTNPRQLAIAVATARGADCQPGVALPETETWLLGACEANSTPRLGAPATSHIGLTLLALALLGLGGIAVYRQKHASESFGG